MANTNVVLKHPVNKLFPIENTDQEWLWQGNKVNQKLKLKS